MRERIVAAVDAGRPQARVAELLGVEWTAVGGCLVPTCANALQAGPEQ